MPCGIGVDKMCDLFVQPGNLRLDQPEAGLGLTREHGVFMNVGAIAQPRLLLDEGRSGNLQGSDKACILRHGCIRPQHQRHPMRARPQASSVSVVARVPFPIVLEPIAHQWLTLGKASRLQRVHLEQRELARKALLEKPVIWSGRRADHWRQGPCAQGFLQRASQLGYCQTAAPFVRHDGISKYRRRWYDLSSSPCSMLVMRDVSHAYPFRPGAKTAAPLRDVPANH